MLVYQLVQDSAGSGLSDRFYTAFYKKLLDPLAMATTNKQALFLNLTHKAIKSDPSDERAACFVRRLIQVCHYLPSHLVCSAFFLISETLKVKPSLKQAVAGMMKSLAGESESSGQDVSKWDDSDDEGEERYHDVPEEGVNPEPLPEDEAKASSWVFKDLTSSRLANLAGHKLSTSAQRKSNDRYYAEHRSSDCH